jgi:hypothetical protein
MQSVNVSKNIKYFLMLECAAESSLVHYTYELAPYKVQIHQSPTNILVWLVGLSRFR